MTAQSLDIRGLCSGYGNGQILQETTLHVRGGAVSAVLGRNGAGKSTLLNTVMGLVRPQAGSIKVGDRDIAGLAPHHVARAGVALVPQGRRLFNSLTVAETLRLAVRTNPSSAWTSERILALMPSLATRTTVRSGDLSGGEQQMLSLARALVREPSVLLLDEPSDGLAPAVVQQVREVLQSLRSEGMTVLLVEQNLRTALALADTVHVLAKGRFVHGSTAEEFRRNGQLARELLGAS